jgi:hypothetical protein
MGRRSHFDSMGDLAHFHIVTGNDAPLTPPHPVVEIEHMRLDLVAHPISGQRRHFEHLQNASGIALAPLDQ